MRIDLDAARAARREARGESPVLVVDGQELALPEELPFEAAELLGILSPETVKENPTATADIVSKTLAILLGEAYEAFQKASPSINDVMVLLDGLLKAYGLEDLGESAASAVS